MGLNSKYSKGLLNAGSFFIYGVNKTHKNAWLLEYGIQFLSLASILYARVFSMRFYETKAWRKLSSWHRRKFPLCGLCLEKNLIRKAQCTDHRHGITTNGVFDRVKAFDKSNLRSLCFSCHGKITFSAFSDQYISKQRKKLDVLKPL